MTSVYSSKRRLGTLAAGVAALAGILGAGSASAAGEPTAPVWEGPAYDAAGGSVQITSPLSETTAADGRVTVTGTYAADERVNAVTLVACRPVSETRCGLYLVGPTNGAFAEPWRGSLARIKPSSADGRTGTFSLVLSGLPTTHLRLAAFASTTKSPVGTPSLVDFSVQAPADPSYISVLFGRANWVATGGEGCLNRPSTARTLEQNAIDLSLRGLPAVAQVVTDRVRESERACVENYALETSWSDLARLRMIYGWTATSQSRTYPNLTTLSEAAVVAESAGSLPIFKAHGFDRAWGNFAYPNNKQNPTVQAIVMRYFGFGRIYGDNLNTRASTTTYPYPMVTMSVNGGRCNNSALSCYTMPVANDRRTTSPSAIGRMLKPGPGKWGVVQFYRIVDGTWGQQGQPLAWDCSSADWRDRWTSQPELYCRNSFTEALDLRNKSATAVDPATVALTWGRLPWTS